jgi:hypothetical protein
MKIYQFFTKALFIQKSYMNKVNTDSIRLMIKDGVRANDKLIYSHTISDKISTNPVHLDKNSNDFRKEKLSKEIQKKKSDFQEPLEFKLYNNTEQLKILFQGKKLFDIKAFESYNLDPIKYGSINIVPLISTENGIFTETEQKLRSSNNIVKTVASLDDQVSEDLLKKTACSKESENDSQSKVEDGKTVKSNIVYQTRPSAWLPHELSFDFLSTEEIRNSYENDVILGDLASEECSFIDS